MFSGHATAEGTARYRDRFPALRDLEHFRPVQHLPGAGDLWVSSIGHGTYLGEPDDAADEEYTAAIATSLRSGINVLDTAINYRHQRSERNVGRALQQLISSGELRRDEVLLCTKAGYLCFDGNLAPDPRRYFTEEYVESGILDPSQLAGGMHCMAPGYLQNQIERSRNNLGVETIDVFYVHNPESQLADVSQDVFYRRLRDAFAMLETLVKAGSLRYYGIATWNALRLPQGSRDFVDLAHVVELAQQVGGQDHRFRFVQLPFSLAMTEAGVLLNQGSARQKKSLLGTAAELGVAVVGSATLHQGHLVTGLPEHVRRGLGHKRDSANAIQFARSAPGISVSLVGMGHREHVVENLKASLLPPMPADDWKKLFASQP